MPVLKYYLYTTVILLLLTGCQALKPASQSVVTKQEPAQTGFLEQISISSGPVQKTKPAKETPLPELSDENAPRMYFNSAFNIENSLGSQFKYAIIMDVEVETLENESLYQYIENWWGTPYRMGGSTHGGIDCSSFVQGLLASVYGASVPRVAKEQKSACTPLSDEEKREGDLVFFNTRGGVSHVGIYLHNNKFVHASTSGGVMISDLREDYWSRRYLGAGRPLNEAMVQKLSAQ